MRLMMLLGLVFLFSSCDAEGQQSVTMAGEVAGEEIGAGAQLGGSQEQQADSGTAGEPEDMFAGAMTDSEVAGDTGGEQAGGEVAGNPMAGEMVMEETATTLSIDLRSPLPLTFVSEAKAAGLLALIEVFPDDQAPFVSWELRSSEIGELPLLYQPTQAQVTADLSSLPNLDQTLTLTGRIAPDIEERIEIQLQKDCQLRLDFEEPLDETIWTIKGSALQDPRGWLEMTGARTQVVGGIFLTGAPFNSGDLSVRFKIAAGACDEIGTCVGQQIADGYTMTIWNLGVDEIDGLWGLVGHGGNGASISPSRLEENGLMMRPEGITIEFDTYPNSCPNNGFFDPVASPHIEIYFDGRYYMSDDQLTTAERCMLTTPGDAYPGYWSSTPSIADNSWHDVEVSIVGNLVQVKLDGELVVNTEVPSFEFKGGLLAFSGGSGAVGAYQRFDDLVIEGMACQ